MPKKSRKQIDKDFYQKHKKEKLEYQKKYRLKNHKKLLKYYNTYDKLHRKERAEYAKRYYLTHKEQRKNWLMKNKEKIKKYSNKYNRNRRKRDINFRLAHNLRNRIWHAIISNSKSQSTKNLIDCSIKKLKQHLESQFTKGMSWSNYGKWHIDHIKSCCTFDLSKLEEQRKCFNYTNLRPLWAKENLSRKKK